MAASFSGMEVIESPIKRALMMPRVATLEAIVDREVESFELKLINSDKIKALKAILENYMLVVLSNLSTMSASEIRANIPDRPHARTLYVLDLMEDGSSSGCSRRLSKPTDDVRSDSEGLVLQRRIEALLTARILDEIHQLEKAEGQS